VGGRLVACIAAVVLAAGGVTACTAGTPHTASAARGGSGAVPAPSTTHSSSLPATLPTSSPPSSMPPATTPATGAPAQLPRGGRTLLPHYRLVAYYGAAGNPALGVLAKWSPDRAAVQIEGRARQYAGYGRPVQPAMELLASVAQGSPGHDGEYSAPVSRAAVAQYLRVAHRHRMLLVLDFQPGRGDFLPQVKQFAGFLTDPSVGVALDPEWKVGAHQRPAQVIGHASAASVNAVGAYLSRIVRAHHLPQKLFVLHQFTLRMLPDRADIARHPELATVFHADGHGSIPVKRAVYAALHFPRNAGSGFKLFFREDKGLMTPAQVMALRRRPDLITYQ
jgi:hypothetical protein